MIRCRFLLSLALGALLASCQGGSSSRPQTSVDRLMKPQAQPTTVVAADIAFARALRNEGEQAALSEFAAPRALVHIGGAPLDAAAWIAGGNSLAGLTEWTPRAVWSSCDGSLVVSTGRTQDAAGLVGTYVTAWQRQDDESYRWTYHARALDDPQPPPRRPIIVPEGEDVIVVPGLDFIDGKAADCVQNPPSAPAFAAEGRSEAAVAEDRTLRWRWHHVEGDGGRVVVDYLREGRWQEPLDIAIADHAASSPGA